LTGANQSQDFALSSELLENLNGEKNPVMPKEDDKRLGNIRKQSLILSADNYLCSSRPDSDQDAERPKKNTAPTGNPVDIRVILVTRRG
jgi:hypothetical protein